MLLLQVVFLSAAAFNFLLSNGIINGLMDARPDTKFI